MGEFPSGQRGQTVNLLSLTSVVRIHLPPPTRAGAKMAPALVGGGRNASHAFGRLRARTRGSHSPPEGRGVYSPDAGRANIRGTAPNIHRGLSRIRTTRVFAAGRRKLQVSRHPKKCSFSLRRARDGGSAHRARPNPQGGVHYGRRPCWWAQLSSDHPSFRRPAAIHSASGYDFGSVYQVRMILSSIVCFVVI